MNPSKEFDYSDDSFEDFEEMQEMIQDATIRSVPQSQETSQPAIERSIGYSLPPTFDKNIGSALDIIDTFILSQIDHLNQLKQIAIQKTINK